MGNTQYKENYNGRNDPKNTYGPVSDLYSCRNQNPEYINGFACPDAIVENGSCSCGNRCVKDFYNDGKGNGICCQSLEIIKDKNGKIVRTNCIEDITKKSVTKFNPRTNKYEVNERGRYDERPTETINAPAPYSVNDNPYIGKSIFVSKPKQTNPPKVTYTGTPLDINHNNCNMADVSYGNVVIPGQQLCNWYKSPTLKK